MNQSGGTEAEPTIWYVDNIVISDEPSVGINNNYADQELNVYTTQGTINVADAYGKTVQVYSITGTQVYNVASQADTVTVNVTQGVYIVVVDNVAQKVIVR